MSDETEVQVEPAETNEDPTPTPSTTPNPDSILYSVKKVLGIPEDYSYFDLDIIMHINSTFMILSQLGVGPDEGFSITDDSTLWTDYLGQSSNLNLVKSYVYLKVRMLFDPPNSGALMDALKQQINEFEWRLNVAVDPKKV